MLHLFVYLKRWMQRLVITVAELNFEDRFKLEKKTSTSYGSKPLRASCFSHSVSPNFKRLMLLLTQ